jgi:hypothetical protein
MIKDSLTAKVIEEAAWLRRRNFLKARFVLQKLSFGLHRTRKSQLLKMKYL